jgi:quinol monooxygenase YgiN
MAGIMEMAVGRSQREALMYAVMRKFNRMRSVGEAGRRAEAGLAPMLRQSQGFRGYYVVDAGNDVGLSFTVFETREAAQEAHQKAMAWVRQNLADLIDGEPEVISGEVVASVNAQAEPAM